MTVEFDTRRLTPERIEQAVASTGMHCEEWDEETAARRAARPGRAIRC